MPRRARYLLESLRPGHEGEVFVYARAQLKAARHSAEVLRSRQKRSVATKVRVGESAYCPRLAARAWRARFARTNGRLVQDSAAVRKN